LNCALNGNAEAAFELSFQLARMPLDARAKARLKASWFDCGSRLADIQGTGVTSRNQPIAIHVADRGNAS
jgi:hypothetical protein